MRCFYRSYGLIFSISIEPGRTCKSRQWTGRLADDSCTHHRLFSVPFHCSSKEVPNHWRVQLSALFGHLWRFGYASFERYGIFLFTYYWEWSILPSSQKWSVEYLGLTVCECVMCSVCQPSLECIANCVRECIISKPVLNFCSSFEKIQLSLMWCVQLFASLPVFVRLDVSYFVLFIYACSTRTLNEEFWCEIYSRSSYKLPISSFLKLGSLKFGVTFWISRDLGHLLKFL